MRFHNHSSKASLLLLLIMILFTMVLGAWVRAPKRFVDVTKRARVWEPHQLVDICGHPNPVGGSPAIGTGAAWGDYDLDGKVDVFVTNMGGEDHLYHNNGVGGPDGVPIFADAAGNYGIGAPERVSLGSVFIDYDNDGDQDLFITAWGGNVLYQNQLMETGSISFLDMTSTAGVGDDGRAITAAWGDFDNDGFLDLYLAKHWYCRTDPRQEDKLFHNNGDGSFTDVSGWLCPGGTAPCDLLMGLGFTAAWLDYDNDGDPDLYLVNDNIESDYQGNKLWRNDGPDGGGWLFTDVSAASGADISLNGMGLGVGDFDNNGWLDLAFSNIDPAVLLNNNGDGTFADVTQPSGVYSATNVVTWGTVFFDHDNDGFLDLFFVGGKVGPNNDENRFLHNQGDGTFVDRSYETSLGVAGRGRHVSTADINGDGFIDLFVAKYGQYPSLFMNRTMLSGGGNWLQVTVEGTDSNRDGIGTRLYLKLPDKTLTWEISSGSSYGGGDQRLAHFGLGANSGGKLYVRWPNGTVQNLGIIAGGQRIHLVEPPLPSWQNR